MSLGSFHTNPSPSPPSPRAPDLGLLLLGSSGGCKRACGIPKGQWWPRGQGGCLEPVGWGRGISQCQL